MMGSLLMALLLLLPLLTPTVDAEEGDLCDRKKMIQPHSIDLEKLQGRWYVHSHTHALSTKDIIYSIFDGSASNGIAKLTYTYIWGDLQGQCNPPDIHEMTVSQDGPNHFVTNVTEDSSSIHIYFTDMDICYSTAILYVTRTDTATNALITDFVCLLVRNPNAAPSRAVFRRLKFKYCPGENFQDWKHPPNNVTCSCN